MPGSTSSGSVKGENGLLHRIIHIVGTQFDLEEILHEIIDLVTQVTRADGCFLYVHDPSYHEMILAASKNPRPQAVGRVRLKVGEGITGWVAHEKKPVAISKNAWADPRFKSFTTLPEDRYEAFLSVPMILKNKVIGVINVQHRKSRRHSPTQIHLLTAIGRLVAGAIEHAWLLRESERKTKLIEDLEEDLKTRKAVERAKGLLMHTKGWGETEAFRWIQKESMARRKSMREIAEAVVLAADLKVP